MQGQRLNREQVHRLNNHYHLYRHFQLVKKQVGVKINQNHSMSRKVGQADQKIHNQSQHHHQILNNPIRRQKTTNSPKKKNKKKNQNQKQDKNHNEKGLLTEM